MPGAVAAGSVRRYLDAHDGVPARVARATSPAVRDRQGDGDWQTLQFVTPRDYALIWAAMSKTNFPWETERGEAAAVGARARGGPTRDVDGSDRPT